MKLKLSADEISKYLDQPLPVHLFQSVSSTNTIASELASDGAVSGTSVFAMHQTGGRGRLGRKFASPCGSGIYMSIILDPKTENPVHITTAAAVAVSKAIEKVCNRYPKIKWVNDIYLDGKKICGILAEAVTDHRTGAITHIILGIGINLNSDAIPDELADIAGALEGDFSPNKLAAEIINQLMPLAEGRSFIEDYRKRSLVLGEKIIVYKGGYSPELPGQTALAVDIDDDGGLIVLYSSGQQETLSTGEISIRL